MYKVGDKFTYYDVHEVYSGVLHQAFPFGDFSLKVDHYSIYGNDYEGDEIPENKCYVMVRSCFLEQ